MKRTIASTLIAFALVSVAAPAFAQDDPSKKITEYDFKDDIVKGSLKHPGGIVIQGERGPVAPSLMTPRSSLVPEIIKSAEQL